MKKQQDVLNKKLLGTIVLIIVTLAAVLGVVIYVLDYYPADGNTDYISDGPYGVSEINFGDGTIVFEPNIFSEYGVIFYPKSKMEAKAYYPLMRSLAARGVVCMAAEAPAKMAALGKNEAYGMNMRYPEIKKWYIGGHGDSAKTAAAFAAENNDFITGVILLGGYTSTDLNGTGLKAVSVYGSKDGILNMKAYEKNKAKLPADSKEYVIEGGCHTYFAACSLLNGDETPDITFEQQIDAAAYYICNGMKEEQE
ncbi:MAG: alpha/beta hydrolase [Oscillospiraceae bacterium]|nr:alpha/beta hydrolase [Oscillospiraceae bacterium]